VVIAIIAVLAAMLLPALGQSKTQSACMNSMRQVGFALQMYEQDNRKLPSKRHRAPDFNHPSALPNLLNRLIPHLGAKPGGISPRVFNCPSLKPNPNSLSANTVPLGRPLSDVPNPSKIILIQEA